VLNPVEHLKKQNKQPNVKIIHLEQENQMSRKEKIDGLERHQFKGSTLVILLFFRKNEQ